MSEKDAPAEAPGPDPPRVLNEEEVVALIAQFRYMLIHEVKTMKLEVIENMGAVLARRSGIDKEIRDQAARVDLLAQMVGGFGTRLAAVEKALGLPSPRKGKRTP